MGTSCKVSCMASGPERWGPNNLARHGNKDVDDDSLGWTEEEEGYKNPQDAGVASDTSWTSSAMARPLLIVLTLFCGFAFANAVSPTSLRLLKTKLKFDPSLWYFSSTGPEDTCSRIPENGVTRRGTKNFYECSKETIGKVSCFCISETLDNVPEMNPDKYVNMCAECQTGLKPLPQHVERFQDSIARKTIFRTLLGISPAKWDMLFGRFKFMVLPGGPLKDLNAARILGRELKQLVNNSDDPATAKKLVDQMVLKSARKLPFPLLRKVITEEGSIRPPFGFIVDSVMRHIGGFLTGLGARRN